MRAIMSVVSVDLLAFRARTGVDRFDEMWEGVLHMNAAPHRDHQILQDDLRDWLKHWWARPTRGQAVSQRNVAKQDEWPQNYRIPDIVLMTADRQRYDLGEFIAGPPLVAIEIRSPDDESYDKLPFYASMDIPETWIIDRDSKSAEVFILDEGNYSPSKTNSEGWLMSPATEVMLRPTGSGRLAAQLLGNTNSYTELPEE